MVKVLYFASLRETLGVSCEDIQWETTPSAVESLLKHLASRAEPWPSLGATKNLRVAVNQIMASPNTLIHDGDEVAFFPPVTGG